MNNIEIINYTDNIELKKALIGFYPVYKYAECKKEEEKMKLLLKDFKPVKEVKVYA